MFVEVYLASTTGISFSSVEITVTAECTMRHAVHDDVPVMRRALCITKLANRGNNSASHVDDTRGCDWSISPLTHAYANDWKSLRKSSYP